MTPTQLAAVIAKNPAYQGSTSMEVIAGIRPDGSIIPLSINADGSLVVSAEAGGNLALETGGNLAAIQTNSQSFQGCIVVTTSDTVSIPYPTGKTGRGLMIGGAGNVSVVMADGSTLTLVGLAQGIWHPMNVTRVNSSNTTATNICAAY